MRHDLFFHLLAVIPDDDTNLEIITWRTSSPPAIDHNDTSNNKNNNGNADIVTKEHHIDHFYKSLSPSSQFSSPQRIVTSNMSSSSINSTASTAYYSALSNPVSPTAPTKVISTSNDIQQNLSCCSRNNCQLSCQISRLIVQIVVSLIG
jgi:hypothetical protein